MLMNHLSVKQESMLVFYKIPVVCWRWLKKKDNINIWPLEIERLRL